MATRRAAAAMDESIRADARRVLTFLSSRPDAGTTCMGRVARRIMLDTAGRLLVDGKHLSIVASPIACGVYRISLSKEGE